ncbi:MULTISPECIES: hypothetical protein [unclassified Caballeronia]|uniref:hypothetical protein n=1 Tax=unclassified Caballeronia TaxID=2646786 RepID=UPI00285976EB|nr:MULTISPECIES: hypothetical protein [unclassified Caballeronia]MDR5815127.1 hypothetical protein [Caballeronia sp. LZ033]MDR5821596.1 hypothetical protein [Caballeronia sp. LZ043]MDR5879818.1 hypothetical protein [Caballeronia sp. LZ032]
MYSLGAYFLEIFPESIPGDGWTGAARFSRRSDYKLHAVVTTVTFPSHIFKPSRRQAEGAIADWARDFVKSSGDVLESSLRLASRV